AAAMIDSLRSQVSATQATQQATQGSTSSNVVNAQARLESARAQLVQAEATLQPTESDSRRTIELANQGIASEHEKVQAESNLKAQQAVVASLQKQVETAQAELSTAIANTQQPHAAESTDPYTSGQSVRSRPPCGSQTADNVSFKSAEEDFATQRDANRRKRDIKTIVLKLRLDNPKGAYVPGMPAEVLVSPEQVSGKPGRSTAEAAGKNQ